MRRRGGVDQQTRGLDPGRHVGQLVADALERRQRLAERLTLGGVIHGGVERRLSHAHRAGADAGTEQVERAHRNPESVVDLAEDMRRGHRDAVETEAADRVIRHEGDRLPGESRAAPAGPRTR